MSPKRNQQTFAKMKREHEVKERRARKQEAKREARQLKAVPQAEESPLEGARLDDEDAVSD
jgi:hypothetical protein